MIGGLEDLLLAVFAFVGGHFLLSSYPLREGLVKRLGIQPFRGVYSLVAGASFIWMILAYGAAPFEEVWSPPAGMRHLAFTLMPIACVLVVAGLTSRNPTAVGGEKLIDDIPRPVSGITTITRHPFQWGVVLWAVSHLLVNGDSASIILFGGLLVLSFFGMMHIDLRRTRMLGADWGPFALCTSLVPFHAAIQGRVRIDWAGIGWWRLIGGVALFVVLLLGHVWIAGIPLINLPLSA